MLSSPLRSSGLGCCREGWARECGWNCITRLPFLLILLNCSPVGAHPQCVSDEAPQDGARGTVTHRCDAGGANH